MWGCFGLTLQTWKGNIYFTELAERVEYGNYDHTYVASCHVAWRGTAVGAPERRRADQKLLPGLRAHYDYYDYYDYYAYYGYY